MGEEIILLVNAPEKKLYVFHGQMRELQSKEETSFTRQRRIGRMPVVSLQSYARLSHVVQMRVADDVAYVRAVFADM